MTASPLWVNDRTAQRGYLELVGGKRVNVGQSYPSNNPAERHVLGGILVAGEAGNSQQAMQQITFLQYDDFFAYNHAVIFKAMWKVFVRGDAVDVLTVAAELRTLTIGHSTALDLVGGEVYLLELANVVAVNIDTYARQVVREAIRRAFKVNARLCEMLADDPKLELEELVEQSQQMLQNLAVRVYGMSRANTTSLYDAIQEHAAEFEAEVADKEFKPGIPIGLKPLDAMLAGWRKQKLYIFSAPSGWGKTALFLTVALRALLNGQRVLYISLEMPPKDMLTRMICNHAGVDTKRYDMRNGLMPDELARIRHSRAVLSNAVQSKAFKMVWLNYPTMAEIQAKLEEFYLDPGYDLVFVDYIAPNTVRHDSSDPNEVMMHAYTSLENWKKQYNIPLVVGTQMNRSYADRKGKRPMMSDLVYGTSAEWAADVVAFIYHPAKAKPDDKLINPGVAEIVLRKNRAGDASGAKTIALLNWEAEYTRFSDDVRPEDMYDAETDDW